MGNETDKLLVTLDDGIKRITINRPGRRNSVDRETVQLLRNAIQHSSDDGTRVVILTGAGESFCAGADLAATSASDIATTSPSHAAGARTASAARPTSTASLPGSGATSCSTARR
jgi:enoyl-CoA hydratase/carnithine racemase